MISHSLEIIFIHIRKTGGNSLTSFLKTYSANPILFKSSKVGDKQGIIVLPENNDTQDIKHEYLPYYYQTYPKLVTRYLKFTIVRNPYDRMMSYYFYKSKQSLGTRIKFKKKYFIQVLFALDTQISYLKTENGIDKSVVIVKYENLVEELSKIENLKTLNFDNFPHIDASKNSILQKEIQESLLTLELKEMIYKKFKEDFEYFGYQK